MELDFEKTKGIFEKYHQKIITKKIVISEGLLENFDEYIKEYGYQNILAVYDTNTYQAKNMYHIKAKEIILDANDLHANEIGVEKLLKLTSKDTDVLVAIGSGTIHDIVRYCAYKLGIPFISCPTAASVDGFCSGVAAMTFNGYKVTIPAKAPILVLADLDVIKEAPENLYKSGLGDLIGKYVSLTDWKIANIVIDEDYDEGIVDIIKEALDITMNNKDLFIQRNSEAFEYLVYALCLSGISMQIVGSSRPASGAEHHISHLLGSSDKKSGLYTDVLHGESVGVGTLILTKFYHKLSQIEDVSKYYLGYKVLTKEYLNKNFYELSDEVYKENKDDVILSIDFKKFFAKWADIRKILSEMPSYEELYQYCSKLGLKKSLIEIGIKKDKEDTIIKLAPYIRNRLTLSRIMLAFDIDKIRIAKLAIN